VAWTSWGAPQSGQYLTLPWISKPHAAQATTLED
jgi:hypothetical protein